MANILMLCDTFAPTLGGSEAMLLDLARGLAAAGHRITVLTPGSGRARTFDEGEPYIVSRSRVWNVLFKLGGSPTQWVSRIARLLIVPLVLFRACMVRNLDSVLVGHILPMGTVAALLKQLHPRLRIIIMTYGEDVTVFSRGKRMRSMMQSAIGAADVITCLTAESREEICALSAQTLNVVAVPPAVSDAGISSAETIANLRERFGLGGKYVLLTLCRLVPRKGLDVTLAAVKQLSDEFPELMYVIAGDGPDRQRLQALSEDLGISSRVRFVGAVQSFADQSSHSTLPRARDIYELCDVFCMPNRQMPDGEREGFGIVFLEAALAQKPVIAGKSGGAVDAVQDELTGLLVDPENPEKVGAAIRRLRLDPELAHSMGAAGRRRALHSFSVRRFVAQYESLLAGAAKDLR
jgi:phosphatidylinositol alpha-1,6-mannosyltransferase